MNLRALFLLPVLLLTACVYIPVMRHGPGHDSPPGNSSHGQCQSEKHSCEHYEKELNKKHSKGDKLDRLHDECEDYNHYCR